MVAPPSRMQDRKNPPSFRGVTVIGEIANGFNEIGRMPEFGSQGFTQQRRENRTYFQNQMSPSKFGVREIGEESQADMESKILPPVGSQILQEYPIGTAMAIGFFSSLAAHLLYEFWIRKR